MAKKSPAALCASMKPLPRRTAVLDPAVSVRAEAAIKEAAGVGAVEEAFPPRITAGRPASRKSLAGSLSLVNSKSAEPGDPGSTCVHRRTNEQNHISEAPKRDEASRKAAGQG